MRRQRTETGRRWAVGWLSAALLMVGCHHRKPQPVLLPAQTPVPLLRVPAAQNQSVLEEPTAKLPTVPVAEEAAKPKKAKRRPKPAAAAASPGGEGPPAVPAKAGEPAAAAEQHKAAVEDAAIGALSVGSEQNPRTQQEATELIAADERRLNALSAATVRTQGALVSKARNFEKQAQLALQSGDAEGAKTLATKAKLLLDDLEGTTTSP